MTTIEVSELVGSRVGSEARATGQSVSGLINQLLDRYGRERRMAQFEAAMKSVDSEYLDETRFWDATLQDGLDDA